MKLMTLPEKLNNNTQTGHNCCTQTTLKNHCIMLITRALHRFLEGNWWQHGRNTSEWVKKISEYIGLDIITSVLQGSILEPYNVYFKLPSVISLGRVTNYADDTSLLFSVKDSASLEQKLRKEHGRISYKSYLFQNNLTINFMFFRSKYIRDGNTDVV